MSYCRFSSCNWACDVYVYEDVAGGWTTHVAGSRHIIPPIPDMLSTGILLSVVRWSGARFDRESLSVVFDSPWRAKVHNAFMWAASRWHSLHMLTVRLIPRRDIGLPFDSETFSDATPGECADRLVWLMNMGYRVPDWVIQDLRSEP